METHTRTSKNKPGKPTTERQQEVLDAIRGHHLKHGCPPTMNALADALGFAGKTGPICHIKALLQRGKVRKVETTCRGERTVAYVPVEVELVATCKRNTVRVGMTGPGVTMTRDEWRDWLTRELGRVTETPGAAV